MTASITSLSPRIDTAGSWSPEECLVDLLDTIRAGTCNPSQLVVIYAEPNLGTGYHVAGPGGALLTLGMVQMFLHDYLHDVSDN